MLLSDKKLNSLKLFNSPIQWLVILSVCIFFQNHSCFAQSKIIYQETFDNPPPFWRQYSTELLSFKASNGQYLIKNNADGYLWQGRSIYIDPSLDFLLLQEMRLLSGAESNQFGFYFASPEDDIGITFAINTQRQWFLEDNLSGASAVHKTGTFSTQITGTKVALSVKQEKQQWQFFVNDEMVAQMPAQKFGGHYFGFWVDPATQVAIDNILILQDQLLLEIPQDSQIVVKPENLGTAINTEYDELGVRIAPDGQTLFFVRDEDPRNVGAIRSQDIWFSRKDNSGNWLPAQNILAPLNTEESNSIIGISADNQRIFLTGGYANPSPLSFAQKQPNGQWGNPEPIFMEDYYNLYGFHSYHIAADGKTLLACLERDDSFGGMDVYVCFQKPNQPNYWTQPLNLGAQINTPVDDFGAFLAADGKSLYFATQGRPGYGNTDIFVSKRLDDTWQNWSTPLNLGAFINSSGEDSGFSIAADGLQAYFNSNKQALGGRDIFKVDLPKAAQPTQVNVLQGQVLNKITAQPIAQSKITFQTSSNTTVDIATALGQFTKLISCEDNSLLLNTQATYFQPQELIVDLKDCSATTSVVCWLMPTEPSWQLFEPTSSVLLPSAAEELQYWELFLKNNPTTIINIEASLDSNLSDELLYQREEAIQSHFSKRGIPLSRLQISINPHTEAAAHIHLEDGTSTVQPKVQLWIKPIMPHIK